MICWKTVKEFFSSSCNKAEPETTQPLTEGKTQTPVVKQAGSKSPTRPPPPAQPPRKKAPINARNYYRRGGRYYSNDDDSLIEDAILLLALADLYGAGEIFEQEEQSAQVEPWNNANTEPEVVEDLLDIDVSETPVVEVESVGNSGNYTAPAAPSYSAPEPEPEPVRQDSYSSGYSDSSSDSCGSCDCGSDD